jgi:capsular exopolysaccharide synthesis family protein
MITMDSNKKIVEVPKEVVVAPAGAAARPLAYADTNLRYARNYADENAPGGLLECWHILRRRKGAVVLAAFLGLLLAIVITFPQTPVYQAHASIEIQSMNQDFMNMRQVTPVSDGSTDFWSNDIQTHIKLLQSDTLLDRVAAKLKGTGEHKTLMRTDRTAFWREALNLPDSKPADALDAALRLARKSLKLRAVGQTRVIEMLCDSADPRFAAKFANTLGNEYIDQSMEARWQMNQRTAEWLARQMEDMRIKLERSEDQLQLYARRTGLLFTGNKEKRNVSEEKLRQLQEELSRAQADRIAKQSRYEMAQNSPPETLPDVLNDNSLRDYQAKLTDLRRQKADLSATYRTEYSKVQKIDAQIFTLETALIRERRAIIERIQNDYQAAQRREKLLAADYAVQAKLVTSESEKSIQYNILQREVESTRQLYESMLQRVKESSIASAMHASNIRIVDVARVPERPYEPNLPRNSAMGLMGGLLFGVVVVLLRERGDRTLQTPGDMQFYLNLPALGMVPKARGYSRQKSKQDGLRLSSGDAGAPDKGVVRHGTKLRPRVELATLQRKLSMEAEAFRVVLTSIMFSGDNGSRPRVLVLTSAGAGEGKSTVASNLAIALAEIRLKVLLIDADMRKPRVHDIFGVSNDYGLSTILKECSLTEDGLREVVQETTVPGLSVIPAGQTAASGLLYSPVLPQLLKRFKQEFDMVLIDTPPMLHMPDARVVGRQADAVVLVVRAGQTTRDAAMAARERLVEDGTRVIGTILNSWNAVRSYGYNYYGGTYAQIGYSSSGSGAQG